MQTDEDLCYLSIADLGRAYAGRELSPVEVTDAYLRRIRALDSRINAYITVTPEAAREAARRSEQRYQSGMARGPLDGVPFALKDLYDTKGVRTTAHSLQFFDRVPDQDAAAVERLAAAGAVPLGKLAMHEFAFSKPELDGAFPPARNPWDTERITGGSSTGSGAALAAGLCAASLGSDTGGSTRSPASLCGVVGYKPTFGLASRFGMFPLSWSFDHVGPMARTVEGVAILFQGVAGYDRRDSGSLQVELPDYRSALRNDLRGLRVGALTAYVEEDGDVNPETMAAFRQALSTLESLGASVQHVDLPEREHLTAVHDTVMHAEAYAIHEQYVHQHPEKYGRSFYQRMIQGALFTAAEYLQAQRGRALMREAMDRLMTSVDILVLPTSPNPAWDFVTNETSPHWLRRSLTRIFNVTGQPAISVPCGFSSGGLPIGLQIAGQYLEDGTVLGAAHAYEQASGWFKRRPSIAAA